MKIAGKRIMITGVGGGIGSCLVDEFVSRGASRIYAGDLSTDYIKPLEEKHGSVIAPLRMNVVREDSLKPLLQRCGDVDILINNAGIKYGMDFLNLQSLKPAITEMLINYCGVHTMSLLLWEILKNRKESAIVNILSIGSLELLPDCATYCASKAAAHMLTLSLRKESMGTPIRVIGVYPGFVDTAMVASVDVPKSDPKALAARICDGIMNDELEIFPDEIKKS